MADVVPNYSLEIQILEVDLSQLNHSTLSQRLRIAQLQDEISRINANVEATKPAISAVQLKIKQLKDKNV